MGEPKQLLRFGESTIIETVVDNMLAAKFDEVIVVLGHRAAEIQKQLGTRPIKTVFNRDYRDGMLTSAQTGIRASKESSAFALMLVDQPFITSDLINRVIEAYQQTEKGIAVPSYNYKRGHPVIFDEKYASDILALDTESDGVRTPVEKIWRRYSLCYRRYRPSASGYRLSRGLRTRPKGGRKMKEPHKDAPEMPESIPTTATLKNFLRTMSPATNTLTAN